MDTGQRIAWAIKESGHTPASMARVIGCSAAAIYQWIKGDTKNVKNELLFALADATRFEARWIATGEGPDRRPIAGDADKLAAIYDALDDRGKAAVLRVAEAEMVYAVKTTPPDEPP